MQCPACGREMGARAARCFYCGAAGPGAPAPPAIAPPPRMSPAPGPLGAPPPPLPSATAPKAAAPAPRPLPSAAAPRAASPQPPDLLTVTDPNTLCPACRTPAAASAGRSFTCPYCSTTFNCVYAAPAPVARPASTLGPCQFHAEVAATCRCRRCRRPLCATCAFKIPGGNSCADCLSAAAEDSRQQSSKKGVLSIVLGAAALVLLVAMFVVTVASGGGKEAETVGGCMSMVSIGLALGGLAMGLISRDKTRGGSTAGLVGLILNVIVLAILGLLIVAGLMMGG